MPGRPILVLGRPLLDIPWRAAEAGRVFTLGGLDIRAKLALATSLLVKISGPGSSLLVLSGCQPGPGQMPGSSLHAMKLLPANATT
jgi:hypothetical protein